MFETSQVQARAAAVGGRISLFSISVALHTAVVAAAIAASIATVEFPKESPNQMELVQLVRPVPTPPPAPGRPDVPKRPAAEAQAPRTQATPLTPATTPAVVPDTIPQNTGGNTQVSDAPSGGNQETYGSPNGVPGGVGTSDGTDIGAEVEVPMQPLIVGGDVKAPKILNRVEPTYPQIAINARKSGLAIVSCIIDKEGRVRDVQLLQSTFPPFGPAAVDAVKQWTFSPGTLNGKPVDTIFNLTVTFRLSGR